MSSSGINFQVFMSGDTSDSEALAWLEGGFRAWWTGGGTKTLAESLGLPEKPEVLARDLRDYWLCRAAQDLPEPRAANLAAAIQRNAQRVATWARSGGAPEDATAAMLALYFATRSGAKIPESPKQLNRILAWDTVRETVSVPVCHDESGSHTSGENQS